MKKIIIICILGWAVFFNGETQTGTVYPIKANSYLVISYPTTNKAYMYSDLGQTVSSLDELQELLLKLKRPTDVPAAIIEPVIEHKGTEF